MLVILKTYVACLMGLAFWVSIFFGLSVSGVLSDNTIGWLMIPMLSGTSILIISQVDEYE